jgi:basic membrane lipoprotein Med (substrate-binding protein (PBP1-ABC) superfamily)
VVKHYTDCGHPIGFIDFHVIQAQFESKLREAVETGRFVYRSTSQLGFAVEDAIAAVAAEYPNVTAETIETAIAGYRRSVSWLRAQVH